ncbi:hypothetical protein [Acidaminobacter sp.]|nr:hypothetical protein [Acidaminobacter sp.]MDK9711648.1 hypothetical protein [Acidaminobacter sp.]MZQ98267.1 hypothetical protein [Acidaminobacter sp.]
MKKRALAVVWESALVGRFGLWIVTLHSDSLEVAGSLTKGRFLLPE